MNMKMNMKMIMKKIRRRATERRVGMKRRTFSMTQGLKTIIKLSLKTKTNNRLMNHIFKWQQILKKKLLIRRMKLKPLVLCNQVTMRRIWTLRSRPKPSMINLI
jgi:hypothetical protein